jgi:hypothetical protein
MDGNDSRKWSIVRVVRLVAASLLVAVASAPTALAQPGAARPFAWRGVTVEGHAPPGLDAATAAHLAVALRPLGRQLVEPEADAQAEEAAAARCAFMGQLARCVVEVGGRAARRAEIPFRDAEDLAESLALVTVEALEAEARDPVGAARVLPARPSPVAAAAVGVPPPAPPSGALVLEVGPMFGVGFSGEPPLYGAALRALYAGRVLRAGGTLSVLGTDADRAGYELRFVRVLAAARVGAGLRRGRVGADFTVGPALLLLTSDAQPGGDHTLATFAVALGLRLGVTLAGPWALVAAADLVAAVSDERLTAGGTTVAAFDRVGLELGLALAWSPLSPTRALGHISRK